MRKFSAMIAHVTSPFVRTTQYISPGILVTVLLANLYLWYLRFLSGWSGKNVVELYMLLCPNGTYKSLKQLSKATFIYF